MSAKIRTQEPTGYSEAMPLLDRHADLKCEQSTQLPINVKRLNVILVTAFGLLLTALLFLPWQQFVRGNGRVTAYNPLERSVLVEAPLSGRVEDVQILEGQRVKKGDLLMRLVDNDPELPQNLSQQEQDLIEQRDAARQKYNRLQQRIKQLEEALPEAIQIAEQKLAAAEIAQETAEIQFKRIDALYTDPRGLTSKRDWELAKLSAQSKAAAALQAKSGLIKTRLDLNASLESSRASVETARKELSEVEQKLRSMKIKINQTGRQSILAPRDGIVYRLAATEGTFLKSGSPLCTIIPETSDFVVELWVDGNDMPLIREREVDANGQVINRGSPVRLQFEGWPAIQFVGWPSVAIGTFGGEVIFVDAIDNGKGMFRILVAPDPDLIDPGTEEEHTIEWPRAPIMRQGIQTQGWVLLKRVPLWFEVWRQLNGFPPVVDPARVDTSKAKETK
jgi:multidrug resistance efflux pump